MDATRNERTRLRHFCAEPHLRWCLASIPVLLPVGSFGFLASSPVYSGGALLSTSIIAGCCTGLAAPSELDITSTMLRLVLPSKQNTWRSLVRHSTLFSCS